MNRRSYKERGIVFSFAASQATEFPRKQELYDYLFHTQTLCPLDSIYEKSNQLVLEACSGNGRMEFSLESEQIAGFADTSLAGPGFHRAAVLLLEQMKTEFGMILTLTDDSGFYAEGDFVMLQNRYIKHLFDALGELTASGEQSCLDKDKILAWMQGIDMKPMREEEILTPMGAFSTDYMNKIITDDEKRTFAAEYFLWFEAEQGEYYEKNVKIFQQWNEQVNPGTVQSLTFDNPSIGYRNGILLYQLPMGWEISVPGAFEPEYSFTDNFAAEGEEQEDFPVYFIFEEQQIRILYSFTTNIEEWKSIHTDYQDLSENKWVDSYSATRSKYTSMKMYKNWAGGYEWTADILIDGKALVLEAEGKSEAMMELMKQIIYGIRRARD